MLNFHDLTIYGAIFDMDGTMFDTERLRFQTLKQASHERIGQEFSDQYLMSCLGLSAKKAQDLAVEYYGEHVNYSEIRAYADQLELGFIRKNGVPIKAGLVEVLEKLRKSGLRMAVATSSQRAIAEEFLINANVYKYFDVVVCGDDVKHGKPHPDIFCLAASRLNLKPQQCLMIEDSENGLKSAFLAQGQTILVRDIKQPNVQMMTHAKFCYDDMTLFVDDLNQIVEKFGIPDTCERFPQALNQLNVAIHGFGAIGGGYLAQIFSHWDGYTRPKKIFAITSNTLYIQSIQAFGKYCIRYNQQSYDEIIDNIEMIDASQQEAVVDMYIQSSIVALCLPEQAIQSVAHLIANALIQRHMQKMSPLTIMIILNKIDGKTYVMEHIYQALLAVTHPAQAQYIMENNYFADTVVNRMVSKLNDKALYRQLRIKYDLFQQYQAILQNEEVDIDDKHTLNEQQTKFMSTAISELKQNFQPSHVLQSLELILFHSEDDMPIYIENSSPILAQLRQAILVNDIHQIQTIKNRLWNGIHSIIAWSGCLLGYETIGVAMSDAKIQNIVNTLLHKEVGLGLQRQYSDIAQILPELKQSFLHSCQFAFKDPCIRVARDPIRKLQLNDRIFGAIQMNIRYGISCDKLIFGAATAIIYSLKQENNSQDNEAATLAHAIHAGVPLSNALQHDLSQLLISKSQYLNVMDKINQWLKIYLQDPQAFLTLWRDKQTFMHI